MKKIFFFLLTTAALQNAGAQLNTSLAVSATPPSALTEWNNRKEVLTFLVQPGAGLQLTYKIKTEIKLSDGTVIGKTDLARATTYTGISTNAVFYASDVIPLENMIFSGKYKSTLEKTGKLLSDNYQICVRLVRPADFTPVSEEKCRNFYLASLQLPVLIKPANEEILDASLANQVITFRWTPVVPRPSLPVTYRLTVMEVLTNQSAMQAFRSNQPILDKQVRGATQYIWQVQGIINCCPGVMTEDSMINQTQKAGISTSRSNIPRGSGKKNAVGLNEDAPSGNQKQYVWSIQALDQNGKPLGDGNINGDGVSEPFFFFVSDKSK